MAPSPSLRDDRRPRGGSRGRSQAGLVLLAAVLCAFAGGAAWWVLEQPSPGSASAEGRGALATEPGPAGAVRAPESAPSLTAAPSIDDQPALKSTAGDHALDWNDEGVRLLEAGDLTAAAERFRAALDLAPDVDVYANNLAEALFRLAAKLEIDDPETALSRIESALEVLRDPARRAQLEPLRDRWRRTLEAERGFMTSPSQYFSISFDGSRTELLHGVDGVLEDLDAVYAEYGDLFGRRPVEEGRPRIRVVFYQRETFDKVTGLGDWAGGVFDGTIRVPLESLALERERLRTVLRHELMHAFIHYVGAGQAPAWLNEGLAQWIERTASQRRIDVQLARGRLRGHALFPLVELRGTLAAWPDKDAITRAYAQTLALVDYVAEQYGERILFDMVAACAEDGVTGAEAHFTRVIPGWTLDQLASEMPR